MWADVFVFELSGYRVPRARGWLAGPPGRLLSGRRTNRGGPALGLCPGPGPPPLPVCLCLWLCASSCVRLLAWRPVPPPGFGLRCFPPRPPPLRRSSLPRRWFGPSGGAPREPHVVSPSRRPRGFQAAPGAAPGAPRAPRPGLSPRGACGVPARPPSPAGAAGFGRGCSRTPPRLRPPARLCFYRDPGRQFPASGITRRIQRGNKTRQEKAGLRVGFSELVLQGEGTATA